MLRHYYKASKVSYYLLMGMCVIGLIVGIMFTDALLGCCSVILGLLVSSFLRYMEKSKLKEVENHLDDEIPAGDIRKARMGALILPVFMIGISIYRSYTYGKIPGMQVKLSDVSANQWALDGVGLFLWIYYYYSMTCNYLIDGLVKEIKTKKEIVED